MNNFDLFWKSTSNQLPQKKIFLPHILCLLILFLISLCIYFYRENLKEEKYENLISKSIATILILHQISIYTWYVTNNRLSLHESLPLYLCRISIILSIIIMFNKSHKIFDVLYFWGLGGASLALIFHDNSYFPFPHYIFIQFFISHGGIVLSVLFMMFVHGYRPNITSLIRTFKWTLIYFLFTIPINYILNSNYCYLRCKPCSTLLDYLPNEPVYFVPILILSFYLLFYLLYLPYSHKLTN